MVNGLSVMVSLLLLKMVCVIARVSYYLHVLYLYFFAIISIRA